MTPTELLTTIALVAALAVATLTDLRARRIPNAITLPVVLLGLVINSGLQGLSGTTSSLQGAGLALAALLPLYFLRGMGAGDVKLMAAIGALKGPEFLIYTFAWAAIFAGGMALVGLLRSRNLGLALAHLFYFRFFPRPDGTFISVGRLPYAPAISTGALLVLAGVRWLGN
jgi:prepilin peptidase CpaA